MRQNTNTIILSGGDFMQKTAIRAKEIPPNTAKLTTTEWRVILIRGEYTRFGKSCVEITAKPGTLGYARRNKFQTDYIQVVCPIKKGEIGSWYIPETKAESLITVSRTAPKQDAAQRVWLAGWMQSFQK
jgi:hypothetical protein